MEKETKNVEHFVIDEPIGRVVASDDVVSLIVGIAATDVEGVPSLAGDITRETISKQGLKSLRRAVKIEVVDQKISVDLSINIAFGFTIPDVSAKIQEKVTGAIESMIGMTVANVNVRISGLV